MCWNAGWSLCFTLGMIFTYKMLGKWKYAYQERASYVLLVLGLMQFSQFLGWMFILPWSSHGECTPINKFSTYLAFLSLALQPLFITLSVAAGEKKKCQFPLVLFMSFAVFLMWMCQLILGELFSPGGPIDSSTVVDYNITCTYLGEYGYLLWRFKMWSGSFTPTFFPYYLFSLVCVAISNRRHQIGFLVAFYGMLLLSYYKYPDAESAAYWCATNITVPIMFLIDGFMTQKVKK